MYVCVYIYVYIYQWEKPRRDSHHKYRGRNLRRVLIPNILHCGRSAQKGMKRSHIPWEAKLKRTRDNNPLKGIFCIRDSEYPMGY
jgi:hypothetical protein